MPLTSNARFGDIATSPIAFSDTLSKVDRRDLIRFSLSKSSNLSIQQSPGVKVQIFKKTAGLLKSFGLKNLNDSGFKGAKAIAHTNLAVGEYLARISYSGKSTKRYQLKLSASSIAPAPVSTDQQLVVVPPIDAPSNPETKKDEPKPVTYTYKIQTKITPKNGNSGYRQDYATKLDSNDAEVWSRPIGYGITAFDIELGSDGSYYIAGEQQALQPIYSESSLTPHIKKYMDHTNAIVIKYSADGSELWRSTFAEIVQYSQAPYDEGYRDIWLNGGLLQATGYKREYAGMAEALESKIDLATGAIVN